ncbi:MAG TPA: VC0807 family protein [Caulobacteraceae bacterium]|nr:VC0807 family protein [Caulobacteraceae bacterium]
MQERIAKAWAFARRNAVHSGLEVGVNFVAPLVIYSLAKPRLGDAGGLMASSAAPIAWSIVEFARRRRVDALSMLVLAGIALSLLAFLGGGGVRFLQLRERLVTGLIGLVFLGSAAIGRPLIYQLARATSLRRSPEEAASLEGLRDNVYFRRTMLIMTLVWGVGLLLDCAVCSALVFMVSVRTFLVISPVIGYATTGSLALWTFLYARRQRRLGAERRAADEAGAADPAPAA